MKKNSEDLQRLQSLLEQLSPEERQGKILKVQLAADPVLHSRSPREIHEAVRETVTARAVGEALARARKQAGLKAKEVAFTLEVSGPRVAQVESNSSNLTLSTLLEHAQAVDCEVEIVLRPRDPKLPLVMTSLSRGM